jgi:hypothetical protein
MHKPNKSNQNIEVVMFNEKRVESTKHPNWGGARVGGGRKRLSPASSVRIETKLLEQVREFTRFAGRSRELIETAVRKELAVRQTARDAHFRTLALKHIERYKKNGWSIPGHLKKLAAPPKGEDTPQDKNAK